MQAVPIMGPTWEAWCSGKETGGGGDQWDGALAATRRERSQS